MCIYAFIWRKTYITHMRERFKWSHLESPYMETNVSLRSHSLSGKILSARCGIPPPSLVREFPKTPQRIQPLPLLLVT